MTCREFREKLDDFLESRLPPDEERAMREHIEECPDCRAIYETELFLRDKLKAVSPTPPSPQQLMADVRGRMVRQKRHRRLVQAGLALATLLIIAVTSVRVFFRAEPAVSAELPPALLMPSDGDVVLPGEANIVLFVPDPDYKVNIVIDDQPVEARDIHKGNVIVAYPPNIEPGYHYARIDFYDSRNRQKITHQAVFYVVGDEE